MMELQQFTLNSKDCFNLKNKFFALYSSNKEICSESEYTVVYFDTLNDTDYFNAKEGVSGRREIRISMSGSNKENCFIELVVITENFENLERLKITQAEAKDIFNQNFSSLLKKSTKLSLELYSIFLGHFYTPKRIVKFNRLEFNDIDGSGKIFIESNFRTCVNNVANFDEYENLTPIFSMPAQVVEIRTVNFFSNILKDILSNTKMTQVTVNKIVESKIY